MNNTGYILINISYYSILFYIILLDENEVLTPALVDTNLAAGQAINHPNVGTKRVSYSAWWLKKPSENMTLSVRMMKFPFFWKNT